jgi:hypothetical protein
VSLGRSTDSKGDVDVDLAREGAAARVSRLQAQLTLGADGAFALQNVGRRVVMVNGAPVRGRAPWDGSLGDDSAALALPSRPSRHAYAALPHSMPRPSQTSTRPHPHPQLARGESAPVPHLSLLEVGGVQLLFLVNPLAVRRALARAEQLVM